MPCMSTGRPIGNILNLKKNTCLFHTSADKHKAMLLNYETFLIYCNKLNNTKKNNILKIIIFYFFWLRYR